MPLASNDSGGAKEFVEDRITGIVVDPEPQQIAAAIEELRNDRSRASSLGERGQQKIKGLNLSWENVVERLISAAT